MGDVFDALEADGYFSPHTVSFELLTKGTVVEWEGRRLRVNSMAPNMEGYWLATEDPGASLIWADKDALEDANEGVLTKRTMQISSAPHPRDRFHCFRNFALHTPTADTGRDDG